MAVECHYLDQVHTQDSMEAFLKNKGFLVTISPGHNRILYATQAV